jgi:hypothetical protein
MTASLTKLVATDRVAEICRAANVAPSELAEITGAAVVTFRVPVAQAVAPRPDSAGEVTEEVARLLAAMSGALKPQKRLRLEHEEHFRPDDPRA